MAGEARITFEGRLGGDLELRFVPSGQAVANVNVAVQQRVKKGDQWVDGNTTWYRVAVWGPAAENAVESLRKGDLVHVAGALILREWEKDGKSGQSLDVTADFIAPSIRFRSIPHSDQAKHSGTLSAREADPWATTEEPPF